MSDTAAGSSSPEQETQQATETTTTPTGRARRAKSDLEETVCKRCGDTVGKAVGRESMKYHKYYKCPNNPAAEKNKRNQSEKKRRKYRESKGSSIDPSENSSARSSIFRLNHTLMDAQLKNSTWIRLKGLTECDMADVSGSVHQVLEKVIGGKGLIDKVEFLLKGGQGLWPIVKRCLRLLQNEPNDTKSLEEAIFSFFGKQFVKAEDLELQRWLDVTTKFKTLDSQWGSSRSA